jgi:hypothetical protein
MSQGDDIHKVNLAKFGYILDMKVEKNPNPSLFIATCWNLSYKSCNLKKKNLQNLANLGQFYRQKTLCTV